MEANQAGHRIYISPYINTWKNCSKHSSPLRHILLHSASYFHW